MIDALFFYLFAGVMLTSGLMVVVSRNPVYSVLFLILAFFNAAGMFVLIGAEFLAMLLVVVYVGAVAVLFLFVVMMLDINITQAREGFVKFMPVGILIFFVISGLLSFFFYTQFENTDKNIITSINLISDDNTKNLGYLLYTEYIIAFEIAAIILLLGIISAITLTHTKNSYNKYQNPSEQINVSKKDRLVIIKDKDNRQ